MFFARHGRAVVGVTFCAVALLVAAICGGFDRQTVRSADVLSGKWTGNVPWNDASGRDYSKTIHTALFFEANGSVGTVFTLPSGALGGTGTYTLKDGRLTVHCTGLSINGTALPLTLFDREGWFHETAVYNVAFDGANLTLTNPAAKQPSPAPTYPLLISAKPIVLSRVETVPEMSAPPPKE